VLELGYRRERHLCWVAEVTFRYTLIPYGVYVMGSRIDGGEASCKLLCTVHFTLPYDAKLLTGLNRYQVRTLFL